MLSLLEKEHVQDVYDEIADHFSDTRYCIWDFVRNFVENKRELINIALSKENLDNKYDSITPLNNISSLIGSIKIIIILSKIILFILCSFINTFI